MVEAGACGASDPADALARVAARVADLLERTGGRPRCHTCLVAALGVAFDDLRRATSRLRTRAGFAVRVANCSSCGALRVTVGAVG